VLKLDRYLSGMSRSHCPTLTLQRVIVAYGVLLLVLGLFTLATQAKLSKYSAGQSSNSSSFKSTKAAEKQSEKIVQFEVIESACSSIRIDSSELFFKLQFKPAYQIQTLLHPYPFRAPPSRLPTPRFH
jgi:hypothetical protein